ncbi:protein-L-isoaspartate O-methyltransferase [Sphaerimonospora cavernae]|uniref:Protein-L-isoaspartate O-methyltransferase n=1 Tax=Sphaerimonospora cavernae TaxID=1740611 RepID=A0ABV6U5H6_9ACTN
MTFSPPVEAALAAVDEGAYTTGPDGARLPQTSSPTVIATMLDLLDVTPGARVLEIGTGSGYSTALLSHLVGDAGHVTTVEVVPELVTRAEELLHNHGRRNVEPICGDGAKGAPGRADEFDRVIAWATSARIPDEWVVQATPQAVIVTPVNLTGMAKTFGVARVRCEGEEMVAEQLVPGGFVEAHDQVVDQWLVPPYGADAVTRDGEGCSWWLSAEWLRTRQDSDTLGRALLDRLMLDGRPAPGPLDESEDHNGFYGFLLATRPQGLTTAACGEPVWRIGYASPSEAALISFSDAQRAFHAGDGHALQVLAGWADSWRAQGQPAFADLRPTLRRIQDGWQVRVHL